MAAESKTPDWKLKGPLTLESFEMGVTLGTGSFGRVRFCTHKVSLAVMLQPGRRGGQRIPHPASSSLDGDRRGRVDPAGSSSAAPPPWPVLLEVAGTFMGSMPSASVL